MQRVILDICFRGCLCEKSHMYMWKEMYLCERVTCMQHVTLYIFSVAIHVEKSHVSVKRDAFMWKEMYSCEKRCFYVKRDAFMWKFTCICEKRCLLHQLAIHQRVIRVWGGATISRLLKIIGLFCKELYTRDDILQKRPMILRSLLIVVTQYLKYVNREDSKKIVEQEFVCIYLKNRICDI